MYFQTMLSRPYTLLLDPIAGDEMDSRAPSGQGFNFDGVLHGLSEDDMDIMRLREENEVLMNSLVRSKLEMAETQSEPPCLAPRSLNASMDPL